MGIKNVHEVVGEIGEISRMTLALVKETKEEFDMMDSWWALNREDIIEDLLLKIGRGGGVRDGEEEEKICGEV